MADKPKTVNCQITRSAISVQTCDEEQGQKGCRGCSAPTRKCLTCKKRQSRIPRFGLCHECLSYAVSNNFCERCRRKPRIDGTHCAGCRPPRAPPRPPTDKAPILEAPPVPVFKRAEPKPPRPVAQAEQPRPPDPPPPPPQQEPKPLETPPQTVEPAVAAYEQYTQLPCYQRWLHMANDLNGRSVLRRYQPVLKQQRGNDPPPAHIAAVISREAWVGFLIHRCAEYINWHGTVLGLVPHYAQIFPLPKPLLEHYLLDARIVLLAGKTSRTTRPGKHLLVFDSAEEALYGVVCYDTFNFLDL